MINAKCNSPWIKCASVIAMLSPMVMLGCADKTNQTASIVTVDSRNQSNSQMGNAMTKSSQEQANLKLVLDLFANVLQPMDSSQVDKYVAADYIQHNQSVEPGREPLKKFLDFIRKESPQAVHDIKRTFVDGDHVIVHYHVRRWPGDNGFAVIDIFRIENGMIKEHWDVSQDVKPDGPNPNSPF